MDRQAFFTLIDKWMDGCATDAEVQALMNYYYSFREAPEWEGHLSGAKAQLEAEMEQQLLLKIRQTPQQPAITPVRRIGWMRVAAAVVLLIAALGITYYMVWKPLPPVQQQAFSTQPGQHRQLQLPDGTKVWLSPASFLQYPEKFSGHTREVILRGEAFFDAAPDEEHPFIIHSGAVDTKVLGTSFNIQAYPQQPNIGVTVVSGKVAVKTAHSNEVAVTPQQRAVFNKQTGSIQREEHVDTEQLLLRRAGILKYRGAALPAVVAELGYYYNVNIHIAGSTEGCFYFGEFNTNGQLEKALKQLCLTLNATLEKNGDTYVIKKVRC